MNNTNIFTIAAALVATVAVAVGSLLGPSNIDPLQSFSWSENVGWMNWQHNTPIDGDGVVVEGTFLAGLVWSENAGWINLGDGAPVDGTHYANTDDTDFGVNIDAVNGDLFGLAWGENVGWINFDTLTLTSDRARFVACEHRFLGYAWAENIGWINLGDAAHFVAVGPCAPGDLDCDSDVTLYDIAGFVSSLHGPDATSTCNVFDVDEDNDIDLSDFAEIQRFFTAAP